MLQTYFDKYGHKCTLDLSRPFNKILDNKSYLRKWFIRNSVISRDYILLRGRPNSCAAMRKQILNQMTNFPYTLHPFSKIAYVCDFIWMVSIFSFVITKPLEVFKYLENDSFFVGSRTYSIYKFTYTSIYLADIVRRFFTGYLISHSDSDEIVLDLRRISIHYLKTYFFIDLAPCLIPFIKLTVDVNSTFYLLMDMMPYIRFIRKRTMIGVVKYIMRFYRLNHWLIDLINAILGLCIVVHAVSCLSVVGGIFERRINPNAFEWYDTIFKPNSSFIYKYIKCSHRTLSILTGAGYPFSLNKITSVIDMMYTMFTAILGHILTMIIFGKAFRMFNGLGSSSDKFVEMEVEVSNYMKHQNLSKMIQHKIKTYHAYKYKYSYFNEKKLLAAIPITLEQSILMHSATTIFENSILNKLPTTVVANIIPLLSKRIVLAGDVIIRNRSTGDSMYFIQNGTIAVFSCLGLEMFHLDDGSAFGMSVFLFDNKTYYGSILAIETSELLKMQSKHLHAITDCCPDLIEYMTRDALQRREMCHTIDERFLRTYNKRLLLQNKINEESEIVENDRNSVRTISSLSSYPEF